MTLLNLEVAAGDRGTAVVLSFGVTEKERRKVDKSGIRQEKSREAAAKDFDSFLRSARCRKARGYFGAAGRLRDFEIFRSASVLFPPTTRRLNGENERRVMNVKGAERISFSVRHAAFLLLHNPMPEPIKNQVLEFCIKSEILNPNFQIHPIQQQFLHFA
ncbi:MAG TPA: hypothetical protein VJ810_06485 [Blastocatellia bacterium]|nr:hypothetical protein [Blastocatellia bacterium]